MIKVATLLAILLSLIGEVSFAQDNTPLSPIVTDSGFNASTKLSVTGSGYFKAKGKYSDAVTDLLHSGNKAKEAQSGMELQRTIDVAAYDPNENAKIVAAAVTASDANKKSGSIGTGTLLNQLFLLQQVQIAQNKLIIRMLKEIEQHGLAK